MAVVAAGTVIGFPWLSTLALQQRPASHGAVLLGLLPLATSGMAAWRAGERPSARFWCAAAAGSGAVLAFAAHMGAGRPQPADALLLAAILAAAAGHAEGGRLARRYGGLRTIAWGLWAALPVTAWPLVQHALAGFDGRGGVAAAGAPLAAGPLAPGVEGLHPPGVPAGAGADGSPAAPAPAGSPPPLLAAWLAWIYISAVTQFAGFVLWYRAMALAGVARTSQIQLLQPFFTLLAAGLGLGEPVDGWTATAAVLVAGVVAAGRRAPVERAPAAASHPPAGVP